MNQLTRDVGKTYLIVTMYGPVFLTAFGSNFDPERYHAILEEFPDSIDAMLWTVLDQDGHVSCQHADGTTEEFWIDKLPSIGQDETYKFRGVHKNAGSCITDIVAQVCELPPLTHGHQPWVILLIKPSAS